MVTDGDIRAEALRTSRAALEAAYEIAGFGSFSFNLRCKTFQLSGATQRAWGRSEFGIDEAYDEIVRVVPDPPLVERYLASLARVEPFDVEHPFWIDGALRWSHTRTHVICADDGSPTHIVGVMHDITEHRRQTERLTALAYVDAATGLPNRAALLAREPTACEPGTTLLFARFHGIGQGWLRSSDAQRSGGCATAVTAVLARYVRRGSVIARYADDTWALLIPPTTRIRCALPLAKRIASAFEAPLATGCGEIVLIPTVGAAVASDGGDTITTLAGKAETALQAAGADDARVAEYSIALEGAHERRAQLERHLRHAIAERRIGVAYQPIVSLATGRILGAEALMRWDAPGYGPIEPAEFITMAEESGVIVRLGEWILREACAQNRRWQIAGAGALRIAVNVSTRQVQQREFVRLVGSVCEATGLRPSDLELELTESAMMHREGLAMRNLEALRRLGVRISIDDFGTGYSSLSYLKALPVDTLKIDRSFVAPIAEDRFQAEVARSVVALAHQRGLAVVGEGVETLEQVTGLRAMGCDEAQGYFFGMPMSADEFRTRLERERLGASLGRSETAQA